MRDRRGRDPKRSEELTHQEIGIADQRAQQATVGRRIDAEPVTGFDKGSSELDARAIEGMDEGEGRLNEFQAIPLERQRSEKGGPDGQGMDGRADIVNEPRTRQLGRPSAASDGVVRFQDGDAPARLGEPDGGGQPVRP